MINNKKKLLFFVTEDWYFCSHRLHLAVAAKNAGLDVVVVTRVQSHGEVIQSHGLKLVAFNISRRGLNPLSELLSILKLLKIYKSEMPDIVHHVALKPVIYGTLCARLLSIPSIINALAGMGFLFVSKKLKARILRPIVERLFKGLFNAPQVKVILQNPDDLYLLTHKKILPIEQAILIKGSGVNTEEFYFSDEDEGAPNVILASRMLWDKGVGDFVEAARILSNEGVGAKFVLIGSGDGDNPNSISEQQLIKWQQEGVVEWWGKRTDMPDIFSKSHIVCLPSSYGEGVPKVLIEAASSGRAIVTTNTPGCKEIVKHNENGLLVPVKNPKELSIALKKLILNKSIRVEMGKKGRAFVEADFSIDNVINKTLFLYKESLQ